MKKNKMRHYETLNGDLFPQVFSNRKMVGKQKQEKTMKDLSPESQRLLDKLWEWLGNPDIE